MVKNGIEEYCVDVVTPNFRKIQAEGGIVNEPFYKRTTTVASSIGGKVGYDLKVPPVVPVVGSVKHLEISGATHRLVNLGNMPSLPSIDLSTYKSIAGTAAHANVEEPDVMGFVDLVEMRKTLKMLRGDIFELASLLRDARLRFKRNKEGHADWASYMSSKWLEYRYGWTPLLGSINGLVSALQREQVLLRQTARGKASVPDQSVTSSSSGVVTSNANSVQNITRSKTWSVRAGVLYQHSIRLENSLGFAPHDIPSSTWELVPFSFVADWFVNVGDWIRAVTPKKGVTILADWTTVESNELILVTNTLTSGTSDSYYSRWGGGVSISVNWAQKIKSRSPGTSVALAHRLGEISFRRTIDFKRTADAIALLNGFIKP